ncbi:MAG: sodium:solute symporter family protein [Acidobacteria bacterium]|nr:sodium:solute symporter family protein [Acidobacteriota bacterium]
MTYIAILVLYAVVMIAYGAYASRHVRGTGDFFVAGRSLTGGLLFATLLAANIGAGSTVGATGLGFRDGLSAWWWVGSAGIGSMILAFTVGPRIWVIARDNNLLTVGDYLEFRYNRSVRTLVSLLLWVGSLSILAGQIIAIAWILNVTAGISKPAGCAIGAAVATIYFTAGGLMGTAKVNVIQLAVKLAGFGMAMSYLIYDGRFGRIHSDYFQGANPLADSSGFLSFWGAGGSSLKYLAILVPSFIISPGLLQKVFGARDQRAVRFGVGLNALCLLAFAFVPPLLGVLAHYQFPDLTNRELALPTILMQSLPLWIGGLLLGAIFAAEVSTADAVLFMLSTSLTRDLYLTFINPAADDRKLMKVVRISALACGLLGAILASVLPTVISALTIFYTLLSAALLLPMLAGLYLERISARAALTSIIFSVSTTFLLEKSTSGHGLLNIPSLLCGIIAGAAAMIAVSIVERRERREKREITKQTK